MIEHRVSLCQLVALPFAGDDVQKLQAAQIAQIAQGRDQGIQIMAVDRTDIIETQLFK